MPTERLAMRRVSEILRLVKDAKIAVRDVSRRLSVAASTVRETLRRFDASGIEWPLPVVDVSRPGRRLVTRPAFGAALGIGVASGPDIDQAPRPLRRTASRMRSA
jgi:DNA-binding Lrp family transcriptional regulator